MHPLNLLILGGTTEASALAAGLCHDLRFATLMSFAGATRAPRPPPVPWRVGGFGGAEGLASFLRAGRIDLVIDATHPFAARMKANAAMACGAVGVPLLGVLRPAWRPGAGDRWTEVAAMADAATALGRAARRVLLTIGQKDLACFKAAPWHHYVVRSVDPPAPDTLPPECEVIAARGPFVEADEIALLQRTHVSVLVTKNSGGVATEAKLAAARACGVAVVMVARPPPPDSVETAADAAQAMAWLERHWAARGV